MEKDIPERLLRNSANCILHTACCMLHAARCTLHAANGMLILQGYQKRDTYIFIVSI